MNHKYVCNFLVILGEEPHSSTISKSSGNSNETDTNPDNTEQHALMPVTIPSKGIAFSERKDPADTADTIEKVNGGILNPNAVVLKTEEIHLMPVADKCDEILHPEAGNTTKTA